jgi:hypothetical protein
MGSFGSVFSRSGPMPLPPFLRAPRLAGRVTLCLAGLQAACSDSPVDGGATHPVVEARPSWDEPILLARQSEAVRLVCTVRVDDSRTTDISATAAVQSRRGVLEGDRCDEMTVRRSGVDTVDVRWDGVTVQVVVAVALPPQTVGGPVAAPFQVDSLGGGPGAPRAVSVRRNGRGQMEAYLSVAREEGGFVKHTLQRYVSDDGVSFRFDGIALRPDPGYCSLRSTGIEHVAVAPRADGPGWRMFFSAGSNECYGWQIFSAVSNDERNWTIEPGVRVDNGWGMTPVSSGNPYWPQGEGIVVHQLPGGEWSMLQGGYARVTPADGRFQIVEYRSTDQRAWRYVGPVLTTRDMPAEGQGSVYSPVLTEFAPGLYRMIVAADNRYGVEARTRLWSAVSADRVHWQVEGQLLGDSDLSVSSPALVGERLLLIQGPPGEPGRLGVATLRMP